MEKYLERVNSINKTILRGCNTYADFLNLLIDLNAPTDKDEFLSYFVNNVYVNDDFFSLIALIKQNSEVFDFLPANEVLQKICLEIFEDYLNFRK